MVVMYYVCTILSLLSGVGLSVWGLHKDSDCLRMFGGLLLLLFAIMVIGVWNLAAASAHCCGA